LEDGNQRREDRLESVFYAGCDERHQLLMCGVGIVS
jgi:hypothetical protein